MLPIYLTVSAGVYMNIDLFLKLRVAKVKQGHSKLPYT